MVFVYLHCCIRSFCSTADLLAVVANRITGTFSMSSATEISRHEGLKAFFQDLSFVINHFLKLNLVDFLVKYSAFYFLLSVIDSIWEAFARTCY